MNSNILKNSIVVAAHPDDEILWFSSLLNDVDQILLCYLGEMINPEFGEKRRKVLPKIQFLNKLSCLEVVSLGVARPRSFLSPDFYQSGVELINESGSFDKYSDQYKENFYKLRDKLATALVGYKNVVTHNPWGEYGHVEHVQVYRAVKDLQETLGFDIWFSNYCSTRTVSLISPMLNFSETKKFNTNVHLAKQAMDVYKKAECWTWFDNWSWVDEEIFFRESRSDSDSLLVGAMYPFNLIVMPELVPREAPSNSFLRRLKNKASNFL